MCKTESWTQIQTGHTKLSHTEEINQADLDVLDVTQLLCQMSSDNVTASTHRRQLDQLLIPERTSHGKTSTELLYHTVLPPTVDSVEAAFTRRARTRP